MELKEEIGVGDIPQSELDRIEEDKKLKCEHNNVNLKMVSYQRASRIGNEYQYSYDSIDDTEPDYSDIETYAYCMDCDRYLTKEEVDERGL